MFGYVAPSVSQFNEAQQRRYRAVYCGLCRTLRLRHGLSGTVTLSNDLTFLAMLLNSLYDTVETIGLERCIAHPLRKHEFTTASPFEYAADMNVALAYHKCIDNWLDDKNLVSRAEAQLFQRAYEKISTQYPKQCAAIETWLEEIHQIEKMNSVGIDAPVNSTGRMLGTLFAWKDDFWADSLQVIGGGLGRFIYMMDAYEDLPHDLRRGSFNPLAAYREQVDFEQMCKDALVMMVADCTLEFEQLPIIQDADILRNILYSGIWSRYGQIQKKKAAGNKGAS